MENDSKLANQLEREEMLKFIRDNGFIETKDKEYNLTSAGYPFFYKKITSEKFLIFSIVVYNKKTLKTVFDFLKVRAKSEDEFLYRSNKNIIDLMPSFNLKRDIELFNEEMKSEY